MGLAIAAGMLAGCGDEGASSADDPKAGTEPTASSTPAPEPVVALEVHSTGKGPKRVLSAPLVEGAEERALVITEQDGLYGQEPTRDRVPVRLTVTRLYDDDSARVELHSGPRVSNGVKGKDTWHRWARVTPEGQVLDGGVLPGDATQSPLDLDWHLQRELTPLPAEPVGVGAEWTARYSTELAGMTFDITERYLVRSIKGDVVELALIHDEVSKTKRETLEQGAEKGMVFDVQGKAYGTGTVTLTLGRLLARQTLDTRVLGSSESLLAGRFNYEDGTPVHDVDEAEGDGHSEVRLVGNP